MLIQDLSIITPLDTAEFDEYQVIEFVGMTTDYEDESPDLMVLWTSSVDGELHSTPQMKRAIFTLRPIVFLPANTRLLFP